MGYEHFVVKRLRTGESPDVYLGELQHLAPLLGGITDKDLVCAFLGWLQENVRHLLRTGSRMEALDLEEILVWARVVIKDDSLGATECRGTAPRVAVASQRCYVCTGPNHLARDCLVLHQSDTWDRETVWSDGSRSQ